MTNHESNRVLVRSGARELTVEEMDHVSAGQIRHTNVCTAPFATSTHTGAGDGDGCGDTDSDASIV